VVRFTGFLAEVRGAPSRSGRAGALRVLAIDGHSASGKTTLANRVAAAIPGSVVLHTDDIAWHHSVFDWDELLVQGVLAPLRAGGSVAYRPPAWQQRGRSGAIVVPAGTSLLLIEGVGSSRASLTGQLDESVWVETAEPVRVARDDVRLARGDVSPADYASWMAEENAHVAADRPWDRARWIVSGSPQLPHDPTNELVVSTG
jgi:uridine kinase